MRMTKEGTLIIHEIVIGALAASLDKVEVPLQLVKDSGNLEQDLPHLQFQVKMLDIGLLGMKEENLILYKVVVEALTGSPDNLKDFGGTPAQVVAMIQCLALGFLWEVIVLVLKVKKEELTMLSEC